MGYGYLGNGITVWNKLEERNGDYRTVAHIETDRSVKFYDKNMPESIKENIIKTAQTAKMYLSNTNQDKITKEEKTMDYTAKVTKIENESNVKGLATVEINGFVSVNSVKIVEGENGLFVSMPKFKDSKGEYKNLVFTVKEGVMDEISKAVLNEYHYPKQEQAETKEQEQTETKAQKMKIKVDLTPNKYENNIKAGGQIKLNDEIVITNIKLIAKENGELFVSMPSRQDKNGEWQSVVCPKNKEVYAQIKDAVIAKYEQLDKTKIIGNAKYNELAGKDRGM